MASVLAVSELHEAVRRVIAHGSKAAHIAEGRDLTQSRPTLPSGRAKPYTVRGIKRLKCVRCGQPAEYQWNCCADSNYWRPLCERCDVLLNALVLGFMENSNAEWLLRRYMKDLGLEPCTAPDADKE